MCIYVDDDFEVIDSGERKARKSHACQECRRSIDPGEVYRYWVQTSDYGIERHKMCAHCWASIDIAATITGCPRQWWWGMVFNVHSDESFMGDIVMNHELSVSQLRFVVRCDRNARRRWRRKDGSLLPVPQLADKARGDG